MPCQGSSGHGTPPILLPPPRGPLGLCCEPHARRAVRDGGRHAAAPPAGCASRRPDRGIAVFEHSVETEDTLGPEAEVYRQLMVAIARDLDKSGVRIGQSTMPRFGHH